MSCLVLPRAAECKHDCMTAAHPRQPHSIVLYILSFKAYDRDAGVEVALHEIASDEGSAAVTLPSGVEHENLMRVLDHWTEDDKEVYVTEIVVDGTVEGYVNRLRGPDVKTKVLKKWGRQILSMLNTLHTHDPPVALGDIRPDNIFINSSDGSARVAALRLQRQQSQEAPTARGRYSAPGEATISTPQGDIYSFGLTLLQLASQATPYWEDANETFQTMWKAKSEGLLPAQLRADSDAAAELKPELKDFIVQCLNVEADKRPTAAQLLQHAWLKKKKRADKGAEDPETPVPPPDAESAVGSSAAPAGSAQAASTTADVPAEAKSAGKEQTTRPPVAAATAATGANSQTSQSVGKQPPVDMPAVIQPASETQTQAPRLEAPCPLVGITLDSFSYRGLRKVSVQISLFFEADEASIKYRSLKFSCSREDAEVEIGKLVQELIELKLVREADKANLARWLQCSLGRVLREPLAYTQETVM